MSGTFYAGEDLRTADEGFIIWIDWLILTSHDEFLVCPSFTSDYYLY